MEERRSSTNLFGEFFRSPHVARAEVNKSDASLSEIFNKSGDLREKELRSGEERGNTTLRMGTEDAVMPRNTYGCVELFSKRDDRPVVSEYSRWSLTSSLS